MAIASPIFGMSGLDIRIKHERHPYKDFCLGFSRWTFPKSVD
jgi:hypothetical protein